MKPATFTKVDMDTYPRKDHFMHYMHKENCTYSMAVDIDITALHQTASERGYKITPALTYATTKAVNSCEAMRCALDENDTLGIWNFLNASYPIFHNDDKTFTYLTTPMEDDFASYYESVRRDIALHGDIHGVYASPPPANSFTVSAIPWARFTGFNFNFSPNDKRLAPTITWGQFYTAHNRVLLPISVQVHHATTDGWHVSEFLNILQQFAEDASTWMQ